MSIRFLLVMFSFLLFVQESSSQVKVKNVHFRIIDERIEIFYDLPRNTDTLFVDVYFRKKSDPALRYKIQKATGRIGRGVFSGKRQKIIWPYKREPAYLFTGQGFYFEVVVLKERSNFLSSQAKETLQPSDLLLVDLKGPIKSTIPLK